MSSKKLTEKQFIKFLRSQIKFGKSQTQICSEKGLSKSVLSQTLAEKVSVSKDVAAKFGFNKVEETYFLKK